MRHRTVRGVATRCAASLCAVSLCAASLVALVGVEPAGAFRATGAATAQTSGVSDPTSDQAVDVPAGTAAQQDALDDGAGTEEPSVVELLIEPGADPGVVAAEFVEAGGDVHGVVADELIEGTIATGAIEQVEELPGVDEVRPPLRVDVPEQLLDEAAGGSTALESVVGQSTSVMNVDAWHDAGHFGQGVKIGIIDVFSTDSWNPAVSAGEVPTPSGTFCRAFGSACDIWAYYGPGQRHGTAVAEIVHDQAPAAQIYLATVVTTADLQAAVDHFASLGVTVISRSQGAEYDGPGDGTGPGAAVVDAAVDAGITWVNSAGNAAGNANRAGSYWRGEYADTDSDGWVEFAPGDEQLRVNCPTFSQGVRWDDWGEGAGTSDYHAYVLTTAGDLVSLSEIDQASGSSPPVEYPSFNCSTSMSVELQIKAVDPGTGFDGDVLEFKVNGTGIERWQNRYSAAATIVDSTNEGFIAAGAVDPPTGTTIASYSSQGPTNDGRTKPDLAAPACVASFSYPQSCFNGTSSAAPAIAGAAAVVASAGVATTPALITDYLRSAALDLGATGPDDAFGDGKAVLPAAPPLPVVPTRFTSVAPVRVQDSRPDRQIGPYGTPWGAGTVRHVTVAGSNGVPADAVAVVLNVTAANTSASSHLTIWPTGASRPVVSSLNWPKGTTIANSATVRVGLGGRVSVFNNTGAADVVVDVVGYFREASGAGFTPLDPARIQDSRPGPSNRGDHVTPWAAATTRSVVVAGVGGVPVDATAVVLNVTAATTTAPSFLTLWPAGSSRPTASNLNWASGQTIANAVTVGVGSGGAINVFNNAGDVDVVADVVGYFRPGTGFAYHPRMPLRVQNSRPTAANVGAYASPWGPATERDVQVAGIGDIAADAEAVVLNVTATDTSAESYLSVWPTGAPRPVVSSLNWARGRTIANAVTAKVGTSGSVAMFNNAGTTNVIADVSGWYG